MRLTHPPPAPTFSEISGFWKHSSQAWGNAKNEHGSRIANAEVFSDCTTRAKVGDYDAFGSQATMLLVRKLRCFWFAAFGSQAKLLCIRFAQHVRWCVCRFLVSLFAR
jgi:hypothetical protein